MTVDRMLVVAPHPDDEVLGVGGTIAKFAAAGGEVTILIVAAHMPPLYTEETHKKTVSEANRAHALVGVKETVFLDKPAVFVRDEKPHVLNKEIQDVVARVRPQVLLVPFADRHVDHKAVFESVMVPARPVGVGRTIELVAAYETLSETHWNAASIEPTFTPNWFVEITDQIDQKIGMMRLYESQVFDFPHPRSLEALRSLALFRGSQGGVGYAEAFQVIRMSGYCSVL